VTVFFLGIKAVGNLLRISFATCVNVKSFLLFIKKDQLAKINVVCFSSVIHFAVIEILEKH